MYRPSESRGREETNKLLFKSTHTYLDPSECQHDSYQQHQHHHHHHLYESNQFVGLLQVEVLKQWKRSRAVAADTIEESIETI